MRKRKLYIAVCLILLSWVIGPTVKLNNEFCVGSITQSDSLILAYPDGTYMFIQKTEDGTDFTKWAVQILVPEELDKAGKYNAPAIGDGEKAAPEIMGIYPEKSGLADMVIGQGQRWIPQILVIFLCGLAGFIFAVPKKTAGLTCRN